MPQILVKHYVIEVFAHVERDTRRIATYHIPVRGRVGERIMRVFNHASTSFGGMVSLHITPAFVTLPEAPYKTVAQPEEQDDERQGKQTKTSLGADEPMGEELDPHIS